jgi:nucleotide-binding universal stress UspA family protein
LDLARTGGGHLILLHVSPLPPNLPGDARVTEPGSSNAVPLEELLTRGAQRDLAALAEPLRAQGFSVETLVRTPGPGSPAEAILEAATETQAEVIVLGTHGRSGIAHLLLGSVAEKVLRGADVPVVSVRTTGEEPRGTREEALAEDELAG